MNPEEKGTMLMGMKNLQQLSIKKIESHKLLNEWLPISEVVELEIKNDT
jgi:hypothetical protein